MIPSNRTTIPTRIGMAATALMAGLAVVAIPIASAEPRTWDIEAFDDCMARAPRDLYSCCWDSGGIIVSEDGKTDKCAAPPALESDPGQTVAPPVLENPPGQTVFPPVIIPPRGPNSGTLG